MKEMPILLGCICVSAKNWSYWYENLSQKYRLILTKNSLSLVRICSKKVKFLFEKFTPEALVLVVTGFEVVAVAEVTGLEVVTDDGVPEEEQVDDSSPSAAIANLFLVMTAALLETPSTPVGVPVPGKFTLGLE